MDTKMRLVIGNKNYSSSSLRPWILMKHARVRFEEVRVPLFTVQGNSMLEDLCPAKQVPVLYDDTLVLWDSLAICEYVAEKLPAKRLWPEAVEERAKARAMSAEMHASFHALRSHLPMNCRRNISDFSPSAEAANDISRVCQLIEQALQRSGGPWLFGHYTVADAMFAPESTRFNSYEITTSERVSKYVKRVLGDVSMQAWYADAEHETEIISNAEVSTKT